MGSTTSQPITHLYILRVDNPDIPLVPFIHSIIKYNNNSISDVDPQVFSSILKNSNLLLEICDVRTGSRFTIDVPAGTTKLGINVVKIHGDVHLLGIEVLSALDGCEFIIGDKILGIENVYLESVKEFINYIESNIGQRITFIILRNGIIIKKSIILKDRLGCEIGSGFMYQVNDTELSMENYNGKIRKNNEEKDKMIVANINNEMVELTVKDTEKIKEKIKKENEQVEEAINKGNEHVRGEQPVKEERAVVIGEKFVPSDALINAEEGLQLTNEKIEEDGNANEKIKINEEKDVTEQFETHLESLVFSDEENADFITGTERKTTIEFDESDKEPINFEKELAD